MLIIYEKDWHMKNSLFSTHWSSTTCPIALDGHFCYFGAFGLQQSQMIERGRIGIKLVVSPMENFLLQASRSNVSFEPWSQLATNSHTCEYWMIWTRLVELYLILILYESWFSERSDYVTESDSLWFFNINSWNHDGKSIHRIRRSYFFQLSAS